MERKKFTNRKPMTEGKTCASWPSCAGRIYEKKQRNSNSSVETTGYQGKYRHDRRDRNPDADHFPGGALCADGQKEPATVLMRRSARKRETATDRNTDGTAYAGNVAS